MKTKGGEIEMKSIGEIIKILIKGFIPTLTGTLALIMVLTNHLQVMLVMFFLTYLSLLVVNEV